jgi:hypothetical protein
VLPLFFPPFCKYTNILHCKWRKIANISIANGDNYKKPPLQMAVFVAMLALKG